MRETRAEGRHTKRRGLYGCNLSIHKTPTGNASVVSSPYCATPWHNRLLVRLRNKGVSIHE